MKVRIDHMGGRSWIWEYPRNGARLVADWARGAVPFDVMRGLRPARAPYEGSVAEDPAPYPFLRKRTTALILLGHPRLTELVVDRPPSRHPYPFPDDPYHPDVDLDLDGRWLRRADPDAVDALAAEAWNSWRDAALRVAMTGRLPPIPRAAEIPAEVDAFLVWAAAQAPAEPALARWLVDAVERADTFRKAYILGEYGNDFGVGVVALIQGHLLHAERRTAQGDYFMTNGSASNSWFQWETLARKMETISRIV